MDHLGKVISHGWRLRSRWYYIGIELGIDPASLNVIKQSNRGDPDDSFTEMIQLWLRNAKPDPTLAQLDRALKAKTVVGKWTILYNHINLQTVQ